MALYTDSAAAARALFLPATLGEFAPAAPGNSALQPLLNGLFDGATSLLRAPVDVTGWRALLVREHAPGSQYDLLVQLLRAGVRVPDAVGCLAWTGRGMHGFRGRPWSAHAGNIHLVVHLAPDRMVERFDAALTALAAVSAAEAVEAVPGVTAKIKWVNDVVVAGCKVGGVLAYTQTREAVLSSIVLGIGLNVETAPTVERSPFVPAASSLRALCPAGDTVQIAPILAALLDALRRNYDILLRAGAAPLLDAYRARSCIIGEHVTVVSDDVAGDVLAAGRVTGIGDGLELYIEGVAQPVTRGRLLLSGAAPQTGRGSAAGVDRPSP